MMLNELMYYVARKVCMTETVMALLYIRSMKRHLLLYEIFIPMNQFHKAKLQSVVFYCPLRMG